jgi:hypothetical protein
MFITAILTGMEIKSPVSPELFASEITAKGIKPVKVKVTERGKLLKSFLVFKTTSNVYGNVMKIRENSKPFIVYVPGNDVEIGSAFTMNEHFWQPYSVFNLSPSEISSVSLTSSHDTSSSFTIRYSDRKFSLIARDTQLSGWDTALVRRYISYYTHVPFESWALDLTDEKVREIEAGEPLYRIDIIKSDGTKRALLLWERTIEEDGIQKKDTDRLWAKVDDTHDLCVIRFVDIDPLLKKRSYFFSR